MINSRSLYYLVIFCVMCNARADDSCVKETPSVAILPQPELQLPSTDTKTQKSRMRKTHGEKKRKISTYKDMTYDELLSAKEQYVAQKNYVSAIKYLEQMIKLCNDITAIGQHLIEIADLLVLEDQHAKAAQRYAEYVALYPGGAQVEYALFKAIESSFVGTLSYDRDQTKTEETLALAEDFLKQDHLNTHRDEVIIIRDKCYAKLAQSDLNICSFFVTRGSITQAEKRLQNARSTWLIKVPDIEPLLVSLETDVAKQRSTLEQKALKNMQLTQNNTATSLKGSPTESDSKHGDKKHMADRF